MEINYLESLTKEEFNKFKDAEYVFIPSFCSKTGTIRKNGTLVGIFNISKNFDFINLDGLEILKEYRGKSIGTKFIHKLLEDHPMCRSIQGFAAETSKGFYEQLEGLKISFIESCEFCNISNCPRLDGENVYCQFYSKNHFNIEKI